MSYPILTSNNAKFVAEVLESDRESGIPVGQLLNRTYKDLEERVELRDGGDVDGETIFKKCQEQFRLVTEDRKNGSLSKIIYEEMMATFLVELTEGICHAALQDPDWWRWLAMFPLRRYVNELEGDFLPTRFGAAGNANNIRWTLIRTYQWGKKCSASNPEEFDAISAYRKAKMHASGSSGWAREFYISQIVRRRWGSSSRDYRAFVEVTLSDPPLLDYSNEIRPTQTLGVAVARMTENIFLPSLSPDELKHLISLEKDKVARAYGKPLVDEAELDGEFED